MVGAPGSKRSYDALGRLTSATNLWDRAHSQAFAWDAAGNKTFDSRFGSIAYPTPGSPRPHAPALVAGETMSYDANGNLVVGRGRTITWNADNLPVHIDSVGLMWASADVVPSSVRAAC